MDHEMQEAQPAAVRIVWISVGGPPVNELRDFRYWQAHINAIHLCSDGYIRMMSLCGIRHQMFVNMCHCSCRMSIVPRISVWRDGALAGPVTALMYPNGVSPEAPLLEELLYYFIQQHTPHPRDDALKCLWSQSQGEGLLKGCNHGERASRCHKFCRWHPDSARDHRTPGCRDVTQVREAWDDIRAKLMATNSQAEWDRVLNTAVEQGVWTGLGGRHGVDLYGPDDGRVYDAESEMPQIWIDYSLLQEFYDQAYVFLMGQMGPNYTGQERQRSPRRAANGLSDGSSSGTPTAKKRVKKETPKEEGPRSSGSLRKRMLHGLCDLWLRQGGVTPEGSATRPPTQASESSAISSVVDYLDSFNNGTPGATGSWAMFEGQSSTSQPTLATTQTSFPIPSGSTQPTFPPNDTPQGFGGIPDVFAMQPEFHLPPLDGVEFVIEMNAHDETSIGTFFMNGARALFSAVLHPIGDRTDSYPRLSVYIDRYMTHELYAPLRALYVVDPTFQGLAHGIVSHRGTHSDLDDKADAEPFNFPDMLTMFALDHGIRNILQLLASKKSEHLLELNDVSTLVRRTMQLRVEDDEKRVKEEDARSDSEESDTDYSVEANLMLLREALNELSEDVEWEMQQREEHDDYWTLTGSSDDESEDERRLEVLNDLKYAQAVGNLAQRMKALHRTEDSDTSSLFGLAALWKHIKTVLTVVSTSPAYLEATERTRATFAQTFSQIYCSALREDLAASSQLKSITAVLVALLALVDASGNPEPLPDASAIVSAKQTPIDANFITSIISSLIDHIPTSFMRPASQSALWFLQNRESLKRCRAQATVVGMLSGF